MIRTHKTTLLESLPAYLDAINYDCLSSNKIVLVLTPYRLVSCTNILVLIMNASLTLVR
jgi:hypothetical protein